MSIIVGNGNSNSLNGTNSTDIILGKNGNDTIIGNAGTDLIDGGNGNDTINGGAGNDLIYGGNGDDIVDGGTGNDLIAGGNGNDTILGGSGNDIIDGGNGNDTLNGGAGSDIILAGKGDDVVIHDATEANGNGDYYDGEQGRDTLRLIVSQAIYNSSAFQTELSRFQSIIDRKGTASGSFNTLDVEFSSIERIEVVIKAPSNQAPTDISLSASSIAENSAPGSVVADLTATDPNGPDTFVFAVTSADSPFVVVGNQLRVKADAVLDFESAPSHQVTLQVTDSAGLTYTETVTIAVSNVNEAPTAVALSNPFIAENSAAGAVVGTLTATDPDAGGSHSFSILGGSPLFDISGNQLVVKAGANLNFEDTNSYSITVRATDQNNLTYDQTFTIGVTDVNEAPTAVALSNPLIAENSAAGAVVGTLTATDPDAGGSHSFSILGGSSLFDISGNQLVVKAGANLNFEDTNSYSLTVRATDQNNLTYDQTFTIGVTDVNEAPTGLSFANPIAQTPENRAAVKVADLIVSDDALGVNDFSLSGDINAFSIIGNELWFIGGADFETKADYQVRVNVDDANVGVPVDAFADFSLSITDANDAPTGITLTNAQVNEKTPGATVGLLSAIDPDAIDSFTYSVEDDRFEIAGVEGNELRLKADRSLNYDADKQVLVAVTATDLAGNKVTQGFSLSVSNALEGTSVDGYVAGATVFADANGNGMFDPGEATTTTDSAGQFTLFGASGALYMSGGTDISTGKTFIGTMRAPAGSTVITPLTTLVVAIAEQNNVSIEEASNTVLEGLGLELPDNVALSDFDPIAATVSSDPLTQAQGAASIAAAIQIQNTIVQAAAVLDAAGGSSGAATSAVVSQLASQISNSVQNSQTFSLSDSSVIESVISNAASDVGADSQVVADAVSNVATVIVASNALVETAAEDFVAELSTGTGTGTGTGTELLTSLAQVSSVAQGEAADALSDAVENGTTSQVALDYTETSLSNAASFVVIDPASLVGVNGPDIVDGTSAADTLYGYGGDDTLSGFAGNDTLVGGDGDDVLDGGAGGGDRAVYTDATGGLTINMAAGTVAGTSTGAGIGSDTLLSVEMVRGSNFADTFNSVGFSGTSTNPGSNGVLNTFEGMGGDDTVTGNGATILYYQNALAGVTVEIGGATGNSATGTAQSTDIGDAAGVGIDSFTGVSGLYGSAFNDILRGSNTTATVELFIGNSGDDLIDGRGGLDRVNYASIVDNNVTGGLNIDMASGVVTGDASVGTDTLRSVEFVRGSQFADTYVATGFGVGGALNIGSNGTFNEFEAMGGNDTITGNGNTRLAFYNATAGVTVDIAAGTASGDASVGNDTFTGVNSLTGSQFADNLSGSDNAPNTGEAFEGRAGNDIIDGRGGYDIAVYNTDPAVDAGITVDMAAGTVTSTSAAIGTDTLQAIEAIRATNSADTYDATGFDGTSINAGSFGNFNEFEGLGGNDTITGNGNTRIVFYNASGPVTVDLVAGTATGNASVGTDTFTGVSQVRGSGAGDTIIGNAFNNNLDGQGGNDTITGGAGNDTLTGGGNTDTFVFADGHGQDVVTDFLQGQGDKINLTGVTTVTDFATLSTLAIQDGANTVIDFGNGDTITLNNVNLANLTANDFVFGEPPVNPAPTDLSLQVDTVAENTPVGTVIGLVLVVDNPGDTLTFELLDDAGGRFALDGNNLVVAGPLDYESATSHDITVRVTDTANNTYEETLTVNITNVNEAPTDIALSASTVAENSAAATVVGTLSTIDPDAGDNATYTLIDDAGGRFALDGSNLVVAGALDYESATSHQITVQVTDAGGNTYDETFTINVTNVNEAPTDITLTTDSIAENSAVGSLVGSLMASDPDGIESATFTLLDDAGGLFALDGNGIVVAGALDYESATSHQITVQVTDAGGNTYDETFTINVSNVSGNVSGTPDADPALTGTSEEDVIEGLGGDDILQGLAGDDTLNGGAGNDRGVYTDATGGITVNLSAGTVNGAGVGTDTLLSVESITGSNFADLYNAAGFGPASTNVPSVGILNGIEAMGGDDTIIGNGNTIVSYLHAAAGVTVDLQTGNAQGIDAGDVANVGTDTLTGVFAVVGSAFNDTLRGSNTTTGLEFFNGNGGDDLIDGRGGFDRVNYSSLVLVDDTVTGGVSINMASGIVTGDASVGTDTLRGIEAVRGSQFADTYVATGFGVGGALNIGSNGTFNEFEAMGGNDAITGNGNTRIAFYNATGGVTVDLAAGTATGDASVGNDTFTGVNSLTGSQFGDTLSGSDNAANTSEQFEGRAGNDIIDGRGGFDQATYNTDSAVTSGIAVTVAGGNLDWIVAGSDAVGTDTLTATESIRGTNFSDTFDATNFNGASTDTVPLGASFNEFEGMAGSDTITGNGNTRISYVSATAGVTVNLVAGTAIGNASVGTDTILGGVTRVRGSNFNDVITGSSSNDTLEGQGGNDRAIFNNATGAINVQLASGTVNGAGIGTDTLRSVENITGSNFGDTYNASGFAGTTTNSGSVGSTNSFEGMGGDDFITGNGSTLLTFLNASGGVTADIIAGTATGDASVGSDTFSGVSGLRGSNFDDILSGSDTTTTVEAFLGEGGDDLMDGRGGLDRVNYASILDDLVTGGINIDMASGVVTGDASVGTDTLRSIEFVRGSRFADVYVATGFSGSSANAGSSGTFNEFEGVGGNDTITGNGNTRIAFYNATGGVTVDIAAGTATGDASVGSDSFTGVNSITGSQFADTLSGSNNAPGTGEAFEGRAGNDFIDGRGGFDTAIYNNDGSVNAGITVNMAAGTVTSTSTAIGTDTLRAVESIRATNFADTYNATGFDGSSTNAGSFGNFNEFEGFGGNDTITGNGNTRISYVNATGDVTVDMTVGTATGNASVGSDTFTGVSQVRGSNFNDTITGDEFDNNLDGQDGDDSITGGAGNDTLTGAAGADTFVFADGFGFDTVTDFNQGQSDKIDLSGVTGVTDFATLQTLATQSGADTVIDFGDGDVITLNNVNLANLTANDFVI